MTAENGFQEAQLQVGGRRLQSLLSARGYHLRMPIFIGFFANNGLQPDMQPRGAYLVASPVVPWLRGCMLKPVVGRHSGRYFHDITEAIYAGLLVTFFG